MAALRALIVAAVAVTAVATVQSTVAQTAAERRASLSRRWISLISADWLPHVNDSSRGCLSLMIGDRLEDAHLLRSRIPLIALMHRVADRVRSGYVR